MSDRLKPSEELNPESRAVVQKLVAKYRREYKRVWRSSDKLAKRYTGRNLSEFTNADELQAKLKRAQDTIKTMEKQSDALKFFEPAVERMLATQTPMPMPDFLVKELLHSMDEWQSTTVAELYNAEGNRLEGVDHKLAKTGYIARVFQGEQIALLSSFGETDPKTGIVKPTEHATSHTLIPFSLIK